MRFDKCCGISNSLLFTSRDRKIHCHDGRAELVEMLNLLILLVEPKGFEPVA